MDNEQNHFSKGNFTESDQLYKNGLQKNYNPIKEIDPKTGEQGTTVPDAFRNERKSTSEIKNVKEQSLTKQLRLQERFSNSNGYKPELIINENAKITKPLAQSSFEIKTYDLRPADETLNKKNVNLTK